ncbi:hypothetical protein NT05LI_3243, partial [Listeria ivanovii FSL F6-596]
MSIITLASVTSRKNKIRIRRSLAVKTLCLVSLFSSNF